MTNARHSIPAKALALSMCLWFVASPAAFARQQVLQGADAVSVEQEVQLGQQAAQQTRQKQPVLPDSSEITQYIRRIGQNLVAVAPGNKWPFEFHVVNTKDVNAFALPGGPMFVNVGAIMLADHEDQLAGVMAHEMSHVIDRHATRAYTKQQKYSVGLGILGALLGNRGGAAGLANLAAQFGLGSYFLKNSRTAESQADLLGTDIMYDAGYNPQGLADFFVKLQQLGGGQGPQFLSDHPDPGNREEAVQQELSTLGPKQFGRDSQDFLRIKQMVGTLQRPGSGVPVNTGTTQEQPYNGPGGTQSNGSMTTLNHNLFSVAYPSNWQAYGDAQSDVTIAPQGGIAQGSNGQSEVAYGVILSVFEGEQRTNNALEDGTHQLEEQLRQANPEMRQAGNEESIRVNGALGRSMEFTSRSPIQGQRERDWLVTLQRSDGSIGYLVFIAPERDYRALRPLFEQILRSYRLR